MSTSNISIDHVDYIDALRGWAILLVLMVHTALAAPPESAWLATLMFLGARGVQLFYIASAVTLCMSWRTRGKDGAVHSVRNFYLRRLFRIAPLFWLAIPFYVLIEGAGPSYWAPQGLQAWQIASTFAFIHGFHPASINSVVPGGWSIAVEMSFYSLFPWLLGSSEKVGRCLLLLAASLALYAMNKVLLPAAFQQSGVPDALLRDFTSLNFLGQFPVFVLGLLTWNLIYGKSPGERVIQMLWPIGAICLAALLTPVFHLPTPIAAGGFFATVMFGLARKPWRFFVNRTTVLLGKLSYSLYLTHFAVLAMLSACGITSALRGSNFGTLTLFLLLVVCTSLLSMVTYRWIEVPGILAGKRLIDYLSTRTLP